MRIARSILITCVMIGAVGSVRGEEFRNNEGKFQFQAPPDWVRFPPHKLDEVKRGAAVKRDEVIHVGFEPRNNFDLPFLLVMEVKQGIPPFLTYDMLEQQLNAEFRREFEKGAGGKLKLGVMKLDRAKNRFSVTFEGTADNGQRVSGLIYGFLGNKNTVMISCFTREGELPHHQAALDTMADSFRFDPGFQFVPLDGNTVLLVVIGIAAGGCCIFSVVAVVIVVLIVMMRK